MAARCTVCDDGISSISGETLEKARRELGENPETRGEACRELRMRIDELEHQGDADREGVTFERKDSKFLLRFLRARKFNIERALQLYVNYYKYRHKYRHLLVDFHPRSVENVIRAGIFGVLDTRLKDGSKAFCLVPERWDYTTIPPNDAFKTFILVLDKLVEDEENQVHGLSVFDNLECLSLQICYSFIRCESVTTGALFELQDSFPIRFKGFHMIHQPWYLSMVMKIVKPFLKQKHRDRMHCYGNNFTKLYKFLDPQHLPANFGGELTPLGPENLRKFFEEELSESISGSQAISINSAGE